jgi:ribokinase
VTPRITVLGSCTVDLVMRVPRAPGPGETLFVDSAELLPGGKGLNQALAAGRLGAHASLIGLVGDDPLADILLDCAREGGVDARYVRRDPTKATGIAVPVVLPGGENSILAAPRANLELTLEDVRAARPALTGCDAFLFQFESPFAAVLEAARIAREAGARVLMNPAPMQPFPPELMALASVVVLNEGEARAIIPDAANARERALAIRARGPELAVITLGPRGGVAATADGLIEFNAFPVQPVDTVGAGDAFCGALAVAMAEGAAPATAIRFAAAAAAVSVTRAGAAPSLPTRSEVDHLLRTAAI